MLRGCSLNYILQDYQELVAAARSLNVHIGTSS